jgi:hypothetical protein
VTAIIEFTAAVFSTWNKVRDGDVAEGDKESGECASLLINECLK